MQGWCDVLLFFFFFKQKTAYELRISDWSSDVCSSDLRRRERLDALIGDPAFSGLKLVSWPPAAPGTIAQDITHLIATAPPAEPERQETAGAGPSAEERRVGKECVSTWRYRCPRYT